MCGRYSLSVDIAELGDRFGFDADGLPNTPSYNIAPTQPALAVTNGDGRRASQMRWGLIPSWARSLPSSSPMINARAETVAERPAFRSALRRRRCLDHRRRLLRVAGSRLKQDALQDSDRVGGAIRLCRAVGDVAQPGGRGRPVVRYHHDLGQRSPQPHPRSDAGHPAPGTRRPVAGPRRAGPRAAVGHLGPVRRRQSGGLQGSNPGQLGEEQRPGAGLPGACRLERTRAGRVMPLAYRLPVAKIK